MYSDVLMDDPNHLHIFVPSNIELQRHLLHAYHDSSIGMHRGRDGTYNSLSHGFFGGTCINMSETGFAVAPNVFVSSPPALSWPHAA